jgi:hypothetical protein
MILKDGVSESAWKFYLVKWIDRMKNKYLHIVVAFFLLALLTGCDNGEIKIKKLNHGDGVWAWENTTYNYYDDVGAAVDCTLTTNDPGELIFFQDNTLNGLYDYYLVVANINDTSGVIEAYTGEVYYDDDRVHFGQDANLNAFPTELMYSWTVDKGTRHKQEWSRYELRADGSLYSKISINLKKK